MEYLIFLYLFLYSASSYKFLADSQSFLFTVVNPSGREPIKITPKPGAGICYKSDIGPFFGTIGYYDLKVWTSALSISGYLNLGYGFTCPQYVNKNTYFTGGNAFDINELEVFKVNLPVERQL